MKPNLSFQTYRDHHDIPDSLQHSLVPLHNECNFVDDRVVPLQRPFFSQAQVDLYNLLCWHPRVARFLSCLPLPAELNPAGTDAKTALVTHFVVFLKGGKGIALNIRMELPSEQDEQLAGVLRRFWEKRGITWRLVERTELDKGISCIADLLQHSNNPPEHAEVIRCMLEREVLTIGGRLLDICDRVDLELARELGECAPGTARSVVNHLLATHQWRLRICPPNLEALARLDTLGIDISGQAQWPPAGAAIPKELR